MEHFADIKAPWPQLLYKARLGSKLPLTFDT